MRRMLAALVLALSACYAQKQEPIPFQRGPLENNTVTIARCPSVGAVYLSDVTPTEFNALLAGLREERYTPQIRPVKAEHPSEYLVVFDEESLNIAFHRTRIACRTGHLNVKNSDENCPRGY